MRGQGELEALIAVIGDAKVFGERMKKLEDLRKDINKRIALAGKASEILQLHGKAKEILVIAEKKALKLQLGIEADRNTFEKDAKTLRAELAKKVDEVMEQERNNQSSLQAKEKSIRAREKEVEKQRKASDALYEKAVRLQQEAEEIQGRAQKNLALMKEAASQVAH
jgi:hypothetical protein